MNADSLVKSINLLSKMVVEMMKISKEFLQALLVEQGLTVCRFSVYLCICVSEIISRPLIGRKSGTSRDVARRRTT